MNQLRVSLVQMSLVWESPNENLSRIGDRIVNLKGKTDVIILPEMFSTGFSMNALELAEGMDGESVAWMRKMASELDMVICGSLIISEDNAYYNRFIWMHPDGTHLQYDKKHLFTLAKEHETFRGGAEKLVFDYHGWKICPLICYDLRFPVWARNVENYDVLIYVANFPKKRSDAWAKLLQARAIENQCFVLGVNIVGKDGNGIDYDGHSAIINPYGEVYEELIDREGILTFTLERNEIHEIRKKLPFLNDRDEFEIKN